MKGIGLANWIFTKTGWGKPYVGQVQGLPQAINAIDPGLIRYAGKKGFTSFKYYELSNEMDLETFTSSADALTPAVYASRLAAYQGAMLAGQTTKHQPVVIGGKNRIVGIGERVSEIG